MTSVPGRVSFIHKITNLIVLVKRSTAVVIVSASVVADWCGFESYQTQKAIRSGSFCIALLEYIGWIAKRKEVKVITSFEMIKCVMFKNINIKNNCWSYVYANA
jgi:hypothetical protein